jgi:hypothetical protein
VRALSRASALLQGGRNVAVRLAGVGVLRVADAGKPDCYGVVSCFLAVLICVEPSRISRPTT